MKNFNLFLFAILLISFGCAPSGEQDEWISLFDGETLEGWQASEKPGSFKVEEGAIVCSGERSHLFYTGAVNEGNFKNFEFKTQVMTVPGANSGVYFHTDFQQDGWPSKGYEVQVHNTHDGSDGYRELKKTGSLYAVRNLYMQVAPDNEWFDLRFRVVGNKVDIWVNDMLVVEYWEPENAFRNEGQQQRLITNGTFALQCHDPKSLVKYRNLMVKPLPDDAQPDEAAPDLDPEYERYITELHAKGFPVVDFHVHLKGGLTLEEAMEHSRRTGINYGIAINSGKDFPINNDDTLRSYIASIEDHAIFHGMQAEGREWVDIFSPEAIAVFDYVFTDAMTYTEPDGNRVHLWMPEEVKITDKQAFMDMYTDQIVTIIQNEPIDLYVNSTFLPEVIAAEYDELWTEPRMRKVIQAAIDNNVAIEINSRYKIPNEAFIRLGKEMGAKFSIGTNNAENEIGLQEYSLEMIKKVGLTTKDMFLPKDEGMKPIQLEKLAAAK